MGCSKDVPKSGYQVAAVGTEGENYYSLGVAQALETRSSFRLAPAPAAPAALQVSTHARRHSKVRSLSCTADSSP